MIYCFCKCYGLKLPRRYRKRARKEYLAFAKSRKHTAKKIRSALRRQLGYVKRDLGYLEQFMSDGYAMTGKDIGLYLTIIRLYEQQQYMYDNRIHSVEHRIVSISQPWLRPIVRGKVKAPVEFGAKFDLSLDSEGYGRLEKISFEAYNESTCLIEAIERFKELPVIIQNVSWQIRYTGPGKTGVIARSMGSGYQVQSWADQAPQQKLIKNKSIRIIPIESKWSAPSA